MSLGGRNLTGKKWVHSRTCLTGWLHRLNEIMHVRCLRESLRAWKHAKGVASDDHHCGHGHPCSLTQRPLLSSFSSKSPDVVVEDASLSRPSQWVVSKLKKKKKRAVTQVFG